MTNRFYLAALCLFLGLPQMLRAQNLFPGPVGIGLSSSVSPASPLDVVAPTVFQASSIYHTGYEVGYALDYGSGESEQYILLIPMYNGSIVSPAIMSGKLMAYRGNNTSFNAPLEYDLICQTAYSNTIANVVPKNQVTSPIQLYNVTYQGAPYLAIKGSDVLGSGYNCTFTGYYCNYINTVQPQFVLASACSNVGLYQDGSYIGGPSVLVNSEGYLGVNANPAAEFHVAGGGVSLNAGGASVPFTGDVIIQANSGGRSLSSGAELEFAIPANTDGTNIWGQARIATVAGTINSGDATGTLVMGTRRSYNKTGAGVGWYYGDDLVIDGNGRVGINTPNTQGYQLAVNGSAICTQMVVKNYANWPDYVFDSAYRAMPLDTLSAYIAAHRHLPDMPSAEDIQKKGVDVGEMDKLLLKKVEELTLYVEELREENKTLTKEVEAMKQSPSHIY